MNFCNNQKCSKPVKLNYNSNFSITRPKQFFIYSEKCVNSCFYFYLLCFMFYADKMFSSHSTHGFYYYNKKFTIDIYVPLPI